MDFEIDFVLPLSRGQSPFTVLEAKHCAAAGPRLQTVKEYMSWLMPEIMSQKQLQTCVIFKSHSF